MVVPPGVRVIVHDPEMGSPLSCTLPLVIVQVGCMIAPGTGGAGLPFTVRTYVAIAAVQGEPSGLSVVMVIVT